MENILIKQKDPKRDTFGTEMLCRWMAENKLDEKSVDQIADGIDSYKKQYEEGRAEEGITAAVEAVYKAIDQFQKEVPKEVKAKYTCRRGCSYCCHTNVDISADEAVMIADYCRAHDIKIDQDYLRNQAQVIPKKQALSPWPACVFLKNNECSIYPVRPVACRKYFVATDPEFCDATKPGRGVGVSFNLQSEMLASAISDVEYGSMAKMMLKTIEYGQDKK